MDVYKIDVTGDDLFNKNYALIVLYNNEHAYYYKFPSDIQSAIRSNSSSGNYGPLNKTILKPRVYSSVLYMLFRQINKEHPTNDDKFELHLCNDLDGHQNDIIQRIKTLTVDNFIFKDITVNNYSFIKHPKKSKIQQLALQLNKGDSTGIIEIDIDKMELHNLIARKGYTKKRW